VLSVKEPGENWQVSFVYYIVLRNLTSNRVNIFYLGRDLQRQRVRITHDMGHEMSGEGHPYPNVLKV
jgi:hypothetical protein